MINLIAKFRIGQQVRRKKQGDLVVIYGAIIPEYEPKEVRYAVTYDDGGQSEIDSFAEDELEPIGETPDLSFVTYEQLGRKVLAIHAFDLECYTEGTKVIILEGLEVNYLASRADGTEITSRVHCYRIVDISWIDYLYNHAHKVAGFGMVLQSPKQSYGAHLVLVNDTLEEILVDRGDIPF